MRTTLIVIGILLSAAVAAAADDPAKPADAAGKTGSAAAAPAASGDKAPATSDEKPAKASKANPAEKGKAKAGGSNDEQIADQLKAFCVKWMGFLETRERDNKKGIKWEKKPPGISGHYVGYSKEYDCVMKERSSNGTPVATIHYKEFLYEKAGASQGEAEQKDPSVVEATEVTEIFRYNKGQWIY
jgi:hypothetical protein